MGGGNPLKSVENEFRRGGSRIASEFKRDPAIYGTLLGGPMGGSLGMATGGGQSSALGKGSEYDIGSANDLSGMAKALFAETDPLRRGLIGRSEQFLGGGLDVTQSPMYGALKQGAEDQYARARRNILAATPGGGALTSALTDLEKAKAGTMTAGTGELANQELARAMSLATGAPLTASFGGLGTAGSIQAQAAQAEAAQNAAAKGAMGQGAGSMAALAKTGGL